RPVVFLFHQLSLVVLFTELGMFAVQLHALLAVDLCDITHRLVGVGNTSLGLVTPEQHVIVIRLVTHLSSLVAHANSVARLTDTTGKLLMLRTTCCSWMLLYMNSASPQNPALSKLVP